MRKEDESADQIGEADSGGLHASLAGFLRGEEEVEGQEWTALYGRGQERTGQDT